MYTDDDPKVTLAKGNVSVTPLRWTADGRVFCRKERTEMGGVHVETWDVYAPEQIEGGKEAVEEALDEPAPTFGELVDELGLL